MKGGIMLRNSIVAVALLGALGAAHAQSAFSLSTLDTDDSKTYFQATSGDWRLVRDTRADGADCQKRAQALAYDLTAPAEYTAALKEQLGQGRSASLHLLRAHFPTDDLARKCARVLRQHDLSTREKSTLDGQYVPGWERGYWFSQVAYAGEFAGLAQRLVTQDRAEPGVEHCADLDEFAVGLEAQRVCYRPVQQGATYGMGAYLLPADCDEMPGSRRPDGTLLPGAVVSRSFTPAKPAIKRAAALFNPDRSGTQFCTAEAKDWLDKAVAKTAREPKVQALYELLKP